MPTRVFTHAPADPLERRAGADVRFVQGEVDPAHAAMAQASGGRGVWVVGGGDLAAQLAANGLLDDELVVSIVPVTLGVGRPLFPRPFDLRLVELVRNGSFAGARYAVVAPRRRTATSACANRSGSS